MDNESCEAALLEPRLKIRDLKMGIIYPSISHHRLSCTQGREGVGAFPGYLRVKAGLTLDK